MICDNFKRQTAVHKFTTEINTEKISNKIHYEKVNALKCEKKLIFFHKDLLT